MTRAVTRRCTKTMRFRNKSLSLLLTITPPHSEWFLCTSLWLPGSLSHMVAAVGSRPGRAHLARLTELMRVHTSRRGSDERRKLWGVGRVREREVWNDTHECMECGRTRRRLVFRRYWRREAWAFRHQWVSPFPRVSSRTHFFNPLKSACRTAEPRDFRWHGPSSVWTIVMSGRTRPREGLWEP